MEGQRNRQRIAAYLYREPDAHTGDIATALGLGESTVRRIRKELDGGAP
jgi:predicted ArsR family transcriptional regulator